MQRYENCTLCPFSCGVNRNEKIGRCKATSDLKIARAALHFWEEPCISGENGSGTVFFSGCPLHCIYCQNREISDFQSGKEISADRLCEIFFELKEKGAHNINFVTPTHYVPHIIYAIEKAKKQNFSLPFVYNTSGYEKTETLKSLDGLIDIYLPDFKYYGKDAAKEYSNCENYLSFAKASIEEMVKQTGKPVFENELMKKGVIVRHLVLPGEISASKMILKYLYNTYKDDIYISIMNQYTPMGENLPEILKRKLTEDEYDEIVSFALSLGIKNAFIQDGETAKESFIPAFNNEGV